MQKLILALFLGLLFSGTVSGQKSNRKASVKWGADRAVKKRASSRMLAHDDRGFFTVHYGKEILLECFDKELRMIQSVPFELKFEDKDLDYQFTIHSNDDLLIFSSFLNKKLKKDFLFYQSVNKRTLDLNSKLTKVSEIDFGTDNFSSSGEFSKLISRDKSKIGIQTTDRGKRKDMELFKFQVFDDKMDLLWENEIELPYTQELFNVEGVRLDNDGNIYVYGIEFKEKRVSKRRGEPNYKYHIISISENGTIVDDIPVQIDAAFITDMRVEINDQHEIICAGFYSDLGTYSNKGSFFLKLDQSTNEVLVQNQKEFGLDLIKQTMSSRQQKITKRKGDKGKEIELEEYDLDRIVLREDGGAVLVAEEFYITVSTSTTSEGRTTTTTHYNYNDILVVSISPDGTIDWIQKIPKSQRSSNDGGAYLSYSMAVHKDKLYFMFNDDANNLYYKGQGEPEPFRLNDGPFVMFVELDSEGNQTRESLYSFSSKDVYIRHDLGFQISENEVILFGFKKKVHKLARVTLK
jgi:hypothetical protein